jgi:hypothetical protein
MDFSCVHFQPSTSINHFSSLSLAFYACNYQFSSLRISMPKANFHFIFQTMICGVVCLKNAVQPLLESAKVILNSDFLLQSAQACRWLCISFISQMHRMTHNPLDGSIKNDMWNMLKSIFAAVVFTSWRNETLNLR